MFKLNVGICSSKRYWGCCSLLFEYLSVCIMHPGCLVRHQLFIPHCYIWQHIFSMYHVIKHKIMRTLLLHAFLNIICNWTLNLYFQNRWQVSHDNSKRRHDRWARDCDVMSDQIWETLRSNANLFIINKILLNKMHLCCIV